MKIIKGEKYSKESFDGYGLRLRVEIADKDGDIYNFDVYTTEKVADNAWDNLLEIISNKVKSFTLIHYATKEQDDNATKRIQDWLI